jgi:ribonuclease R
MTKKKNTTKKKSKLEQRSENFYNVIQQFLNGKQFRPMTFHDLAGKLAIIEDHLGQFQEVIDGLCSEGKILLKQGRYQAPEVQQIAPSQSSNNLPKNTVQGTIRINHRGFGFVEVEGKNEWEGDIFIPRHSVNQAIDGDKVQITVSPNVSEKGPEGKVLSVVERGRSHLAGICTNVDQRYAFVYVPVLGQEKSAFFDIPKKTPIEVGDRVIMEVEQWGDGDDIRCQFVRKIGHIQDPSTDVACAIEEFEIRKDFPKEILEEVKTWGKSVSQKDIAPREDLRELETFTIDPDTAKDFDDALSLSRDKTGLYHLAVHIADVSHYVKLGSKLDSEALLRSNSTYFPGTCIPMLPKELSENLCSLKPNVNRLTVTVFMDFDPAGEMTAYRIAKTVIKSAKRYTYKNAKKILDGNVKSPHKEKLELMAELCLLLKKKRYDRGSVEFAMPELVVLVDEKGIPTGTDYVEYDITHQLVEEFMLKANETVARHLDSQGKNVPYRVHDEPSEDNLRDFSILAQAFGFKIPLKPTPQDIQKLFDEALSTPYGQYLATSYIRRMRLAVYSPVNIGHFGLALTHYCHFTSPIRRYVDLVAHRLIFEKPADIKALEHIAEMCSDQERVSAKAEMSVLNLKKYRLLEQFYKDDPQRQYEAIITRIRPFGVTFEILELMLEGFIHISELGTDYYEFEEKSNRLRGVRRGEIFTSGEKIHVMLKEIDLIFCESKWNMVGSKESNGSRDVKRTNRKRTRSSC